jgi:uncharacterized protein
LADSKKTGHFEKPMKIQVIVKAGARHAKVEEKSEGVFSVSVNEPPEEGRANGAVLRALGDHLNIPPTRLRIVFGHKSKRKLIEVIDGVDKKK